MKKTLYLMSMIIMLCAFLPTHIHSGTKSAYNKKAHVLYKKRLKSLKKIDSAAHLTHKYTDITGDGIHEMFVEYQPYPGVSGGSDFDIYTYKKGKVKLILRDEGGFIKIKVNKKRKTLIGYGRFHLKEWYEYYQIKNGKYKKIAQKHRFSKKRGSKWKTPWEHYDHEGNYITKKEFTKYIKKFTGKNKILKMKLQ